MTHFAECKGICILVQVSEAVSDGFSEYAPPCGMTCGRAGRGGPGGRGVKRAVGLKGVDRLVFSLLKPTG